LSSLLRESGLSFKAVGESAISIGKFDQEGTQPISGDARSGYTRLAKADAGAVAGATAQQHEAAGDSIESKKETVEEVVVTSTRPFKPENSDVATKFPLALVETPQSISIVTEDLLATVGAHDIFDLDGLVPGLQEQGTSNGFDARFIMRGFPLSREDGIKIDGISIPNRFVLDLAAIERVEVVRGPSSVIYGQTDYGGTINFVLKRPKLGETALSGRATVGSFDFSRADLDVMAPLGDRSGVRLVGAYEKSDSFVDLVNHTTKVIAPSFLFNLGERTDLFISSYFQERNGRDHLGFGAFEGGVIPNVPKENFIGPAWNRFQSRATQTIAQLRHGLTDSFDLSLNVAFSDVTSGFRTAFADGRPDAQGNQQMRFNTDSINRTKTTYAEVVGTYKFQGWGEEPSLVSVTADTRTINARGSGVFRQQRVIGDINIFHPRQGNQVPFIPIPRNYLSETEDNLHGISATTLLRFPHRLSLMLGGRYGRANTTEFIVDEGVPPGPPGVGEIGGKNSNEVFVPKAGLTWEFVPNWYAYGTYAEGIIFQFARDYRHQLLPNETGVQKELGIKADLLGKRLGLAAALFSIDRKDVLMTDPNNPDFSITADAQEHRGLEFEVLGQPLPGLNVSANYAWLDVKVMNEAEFGSSRQANVPEHSGGLFVNQEFSSGWLDGLSAGFGVSYVGSRAADSYTSPAAELPAYTRLDLFASYQFKEKYRIGINARNITDETILVSSFGVDDGGLMYREARSVSVTFDMRL